MYTLSGVPASSGVAFAPAITLVRSAGNPNYDRPWALDPEAESEFYRRSLKFFSERLRQTANPALDQQRDLYGAAAGYMTAPENTRDVIALIRKGDTAPMAARTVLIGGLSSFHFSYDLDDASSTSELRALELLLREFVQSLFMRGITISSLPSLKSDAVIIARALTPAQLLSLDTRYVKAVMLEEGRASGHLALALRELGIPSVFSAAGACQIKSGTLVLVDGNTGVAAIDPPRDACEAMEARQDLFRGDLDDDAQGPVEILCSVGATRNTELTGSSLHGGLGLLRSEFLFLSSDHEPSEDEMRDAFKSVCSLVPEGRPLNIRTFDFAGDKQPMFDCETDTMGPMRGYGACVSSRLLKKELRAIMSAAPGRRIRIVFPLVTRLSEARYLNRLADACMQELDYEKIPHSEYETALMIETPAAVLSAQAFADKFSMFIIGTSSLAEYASAPRPADTSFTPPLAKLIATAARAADKSGIPVGVAGRFASRVELIPFFLKLGASFLTVDSYEIPKLREAVERMDLGGAKPDFDEKLYSEVMNIFRGEDIARLVDRLNR
jgi:phosphotransferase system enzyme I (PtsI)